MVAPEPGRSEEAREEKAQTIKGSKEAKEAKKATKTARDAQIDKEEVKKMRDEMKKEMIKHFQSRIPELLTPVSWMLRKIKK